MIVPTLTQRMVQLFFFLLTLAMVCLARTLTDISLTRNENELLADVRDQDYSPVDPPSTTSTLPKYPGAPPLIITANEKDLLASIGDQDYSPVDPPPTPSTLPKYPGDPFTPAEDSFEIDYRGPRTHDQPPPPPLY